MKECEFEGCDASAICQQNGIWCCERCRQGFESVGFGVVRFGGRWHGVKGAKYSAENPRLFPGVEFADGVQ